MSIASIEQVVDRHRKELLGLDGVARVAAGWSPTVPGKTCVLVFVTSQQWPTGLEDRLDGFDVEIVCV